MKFSGENLNRIFTKAKETKDKLAPLLRRSVLLTAMAIASYTAFDRYSPAEDYSSFNSFNEAFKKARQNNEQVFIWKNKRFTTDLIEKSFSDNYWESKKFLEDYYSSDYFKSKNIPGLSDSLSVELDLAQDIRNNPRFIELDKKFEDTHHFDPMEWDEYNKFLDAWLDIKNSSKFKQIIDLLPIEKSKQRITNLKEPTYFSIYHAKGDLKEDGFYRNNDEGKEIFIYSNKNKPDATNAIHELTHKSTEGNKNIDIEQYVKMNDKAFNSVKKDYNFISKYGQEGFDYLSDPTEIDARQNETRFWLFKNYPDYKANTVFDAKHYEFLKNNKEKLSYGIRQLMDLFPKKEDFISNMNTF
jgi:hypothetical protein